jgi:hypothetical protein
MQFVNSTMITPKLTAVMMAVTALIGAGPVAAFAQAANVQEIGDLVNAANIETGGNTQVNAAETTQTAVNNIEISNEAESGDAEAEGGDAEAEAEAESESESGDATNKGKKGEASSESESEAEAAALAVGGDADATSGDATAVQVIEGNEFDQEVEQESETTQVNLLEDNDDVTAIQANVPIQAQLDPIAIDLEAVLEGLAL